MSIKLAYWGHYDCIFHSQYIDKFEYFGFEENKYSKSLYSAVIKSGKNAHIVKSKKEMLDVIKNEQKVDLTIVGSFGIILSSEIIDYLNRKVINLHAASLPDYRGGLPLPQVILNREEKMGFTSHVLNEEIDSGAIILKKYIDIDYSKNYESNNIRLVQTMPEVLDESIKLFIEEKIDFSKKYCGGTYHPVLDQKTLDRVMSISKLQDLFN